MSEGKRAERAAGPVTPVGQPDNADHWAAALEVGERVIWQGRPVLSGSSSSDGRFWWLFGGVFFLLGAIFLPVGLWASEVRFVFLPFGVVMLAVGIASFILPRRFAGRRLERMRYALTDRRALVDTGDMVHTWPLSPGVIVGQKLGSPGSIIFAREPTSVTINDEVVMRDLGFIDIAEAPEIAQIIHRLTAPSLASDGESSA